MIDDASSALPGEVPGDVTPAAEAPVAPAALALEPEPGPAAVDAPLPPRSRAVDRLRALFQVFLCSGLPTQLLIERALVTAGLRPFLAGPGEHLNPTFIFIVALGDTVLIVLLVAAFLRADGESFRTVVIGRRPLSREVLAGVSMVFPVIVGAALVVLAARWLWPSLHNVADNPLIGMLQSRRDVVLFAITAVVAGGVREEVQRAFLLTRFEQHLGGAAVGLVVTSLAFGAGHALQGWDATVVTGVLGLTWAAVYLRRRSAVAPMVSHIGFNGLQIVAYLAVGGRGV